MDKPNFYIKVNDGFCEYEFPLDIDGNHSINDVMEVIYKSFNLPMCEGILTSHEE